MLKYIIAYVSFSIANVVILQLLQLWLEIHTLYFISILNLQNIIYVCYILQFFLVALVFSACTCVDQDKRLETNPKNLFLANPVPNPSPPPRFLIMNPEFLLLSWLITKYEMNQHRIRYFASL